MGPMRSLFVALSVVCLTGAAPLAPAAARPALRLRGGGNSGGGGGGGSATLVAARGGKRAAAAEEEATARGVAGLVGGILIHLACGSMYTWGNLVSYAPPHLKYWAGAVGSGPADAQLVLPLILVSQMTGMPLGPLLEKKLGPTLTALLGALMMGIGVMAAATAPSLASFCVCYAVVFGLGVGVAYQMPIIAGGRWFPAKKGVVTGSVASFVPLTLLQGTTLLSFPALAASRLTFLLATVAMLFCMGGTFALFPAQAMRVYGASGASVYSIMFTAFGSAALLGPIASNALLQRGGYPLVFSVLGLCSFGSAALTLASQ
ncbi:hypothetical protein EMIHUDRAFT_115078 [Emiliania huxleyi CCMP1516]|uniref:Major facilitator superfamily (MFS) profile domain-containing protein n=2 Tax=Emiliania huxleyi TaxID=2903 RepID=A0A0D3JS02_EMIH1|nr:hypothetical protein EMIHUDRAFT_115078 [Emiliania huxleyi CCMP1516]EOD26287.1 hypothetical protein EMIHUDRAFT_115078 [Emiliania huxleyi CCMP1516]|eukprot:XP_005778716.1 hypothetical protein EMIHUDRAFT_115078 [Emiliania huxleyi CCMP1516]